MTDSFFLNIYSSYLVIYLTPEPEAWSDRSSFVSRLSSILPNTHLTMDPVQIAKGCYVVSKQWDLKYPSNSTLVKVMADRCDPAAARAHQPYPGRLRGRRLRPTQEVRLRGIRIQVKKTKKSSWRRLHLLSYTQFKTSNYEFVAGTSSPSTCWESRACSYPRLSCRRQGRRFRRWLQGKITHWLKIFLYLYGWTNSVLELFNLKGHFGSSEFLIKPTVIHRFESWHLTGNPST